LDNLSKDVKKVQKYDTFTSNIYDTIISWVRLTITDRSIKENLSENNFIIDNNTLHFSCNHSPLLVSQVILNLVKNSIDHNQNMLDNLKIKISGDIDKKCLIYEDNGRGIPEPNLDSIFMPGVTTKEKDKEIHGIGLSLCRDYCSTMGAILLAEPYDRGAKFVIFFEYDSTKSFEDTKIRRARQSRDSSTASLRILCNNPEK
jgi:signal transduction histidine kinase